MASETTSSEQLFSALSQKSANNRQRSSRNSSRFYEQRDRNRSPARSSYSDNSDNDREYVPHTSSSSSTKLQQHHRPKCGYSSSQEVDEPATNPADAMEPSSLMRQRKHDKPTNGAGSTQLHVTSNTKISNTDSWEVVETYTARESDRRRHSASGYESGDDIRKSKSSGLLAQSKPKIRKRKKEAKSTPTQNARTIKRCQMYAILNNIGNEWRLYKFRHSSEWQTLKYERNKCFVGSILIFIYCGFGGMIFHFTEGAFEMYYKCGVKRVKRDFLDSLWANRYLKEDEWKSMSRAKLMEFENQLYDAYDAGLSSYSGQKGWSFVNSFIYSTTLVTTVGYGHLAPVTVAGRIMTIIYSIIGIPLFLILLADYGKLLTRGIKFFWTFVRELYYKENLRRVRKAVPAQKMVKGVQMMSELTTQRNSSDISETVYTCPPSKENSEIDDNFNLPITVAFVVLSLYMIGGAYLFSFLEGWTVFESFYFVFISTSTIGLGDFVPKGQTYVLLCSLVYFIFGLALTSMFINIVTEKLTDEFGKAIMKIGATMGLQRPENNLQVSVNNENTEPNLGYEETPLDD